ncbi:MULTISPECIES: rhodanese-like domain-containing protein [unclassified Meridianimarinicoccus]|uniref:rhodanese-like domain-containing protein n=1 Tax=unclassified Meridianimarinicoccus TaxID=2923344 RepID=UPI001867029D|nr:rhodanese-like domain-containing protein [Fluviibacterium sp. MJW13]
MRLRPGGPLSRRTLLLGGLSGAALAAGGWYAWILRRPFDGRQITPIEAHDLAAAGQIFLIDIRRPDEWAATGVGAGAMPLDMRRPDFTEALARLTAADPARPIALICARGVRSSQLTARLAEQGLTNLVDVPEGMVGSRAGPGWVARGLPVRQVPG